MNETGLSSDRPPQDHFAPATGQRTPGSNPARQRHHDPGGARRNKSDASSWRRVARGPPARESIRYGPPRARRSNACEQIGRLPAPKNQNRERNCPYKPQSLARFTALVNLVTNFAGTSLTALTAKP